jgi:glycosyltransferase involved in cell wall biosynthesis
MKILMLGRYELLDKGGGDKVQVENTAAELRKMGVEVDIKAGFGHDMTPYDLVHVFQLDWTPETYFYAKSVKEAGKPLVLSPIHHNIGEVKKFDDIYAFDFRRVSKLLFSEQHHRDTFKNMYRSIFDRRKLKPTLKSIFIGLKKMHIRTLELSDVVIVQTEAEARDLEETYKVSFDWRKISNGVGRPFLETREFTNKMDHTNYLICVGRIEPRKNQLNIIKAVKKLREMRDEDIKLLLIGAPGGKNHIEYMMRFKKALEENPWITHIAKVPYEDMPSYYHFAKVCISASWFETTGLTSMEALYSGINAVAAGERAKEVLGNLVSYCLPYDVDSIVKAIETELDASRPEVPQELKHEYTWENAAAKTLEVYKSVLKL